MTTEQEQGFLGNPDYHFTSAASDEQLALMASTFLITLYTTMGLSVAPEHVSDLHDIQESYSEDNGDFFILLDESQENTVVATVAYTVVEPGVAYLTRLATNPEYRLKGLGRGMYQAMLEQLREKGFTKATFSTLQSFNMVEAYKRWGFEIVKEEPITTGRGEDVEVTMEMTI